MNPPPPAPVRPFVIISPVRDEERNIEKTLESMLAQTVRPLRWVIVDDGSNDRTPELIEQFLPRASFLTLIRNQRRTGRQTGVAEVLAFNTGLKEIAGLDYDYVVKLDGDLSFAPDYFEQILDRMDANPKLGITSGAYEERRDGSWTEIVMPPYHACGASKVIRRACFEQIEGFVSQRGWDTVDEIRAIARGWQTTHFRDLMLKHWKAEGSGMGVWHTSAMHGEIFYRTGGGALLFLPKFVNRLRHRPYLIAALAMLWGFMRPFLKRTPKLVTPHEGRAYRALLHQRVAARLSASPRANAAR